MYSCFYNHKVYDSFLVIPKYWKCFKGMSPIISKGNVHELAGNVTYISKGNVHELAGNVTWRNDGTGVGYTICVAPGLST